MACPTSAWIIGEGRLAGGHMMASGSHAQEAALFAALLAQRRGTGAAPILPPDAAPAAAALLELYGPLAAVPPGTGFAVAHLAQSLDGRIATLSGASQWLTGEAD